MHPTVKVYCKKHHILTVGVSASVNVVLSRKHSSTLLTCTEKYHNNVTECLLFSCKAVQFEFHTVAHCYWHGQIRMEMVGMLWGTIMLPFNKVNEMK